MPSADAAAVLHGLIRDGLGERSLQSGGRDPATALDTRGPGLGLRMRKYCYRPLPGHEQVTRQLSNLNTLAC